MTPRIDAHVHVWDLDRSPYAWLGSPGLDPIRRTIGLDDGAADLDRAAIDGVILVQADDTDADTDLMRDAAAADPRVAGVVAWVPLDQPERVAERLREIASPTVVGVRALIHDMPDPDWILRPEVGEGLDLLAAAGLSFDVVAVTARHLANAVRVGERHPDLRVVIDHLAKPPIGLADREPWWSLIAEASRNTQVTAKLSGLYSATAHPASWTPDELGPFIEHALELFGADRLMYGSDWPFSVPSGGYPRTWNAISQHLATLTDAERSAILGGTAVRHYRLDDRRLQAAQARRIR